MSIFVNWSVGNNKTYNANRMEFNHQYKDNNALAEAENRYKLLDDNGNKVTNRRIKDYFMNVPRHENVDTFNG